jgi:chromate transporter
MQAVPTSREAPSVPALSLPALFRIFLYFGFNAWGGPAAQIAMIKDRLVDTERWISVERFNRALAVYQALPGPEAHELCCYFGYLARGRIGAFVAGLGFMLPGFILMVLAALAYLWYGPTSGILVAALFGMKPAVAAVVTRAVYRIGTHALSHDSWRWVIGIVAGVVSFFEVHFTLVLLVGGFTLVAREFRYRLLAGGLLAALLLAIPLTAPSISSETASRGEIIRAEALPLLVSGLRAGAFTFGGAYTVIPFLREDAVIDHRWITEEQFIDGIGIAGVLPAPLVIFGTFIGLLAGGLLGAIAMTVGIFAPAFAFTMIGHEIFERLIEHKPLHQFLDGVTAAVVGIIAATAIGIIRESTQSWIAAGIFIAALLVLFTTTNRFVVPLLIFGAALVGISVSS